MSSTRPTRTRRAAQPDQPEQLELLTPTGVPLQFRLDDRTRRRGLAHVAAIRQQLALQAARRAAEQHVPSDAAAHAGLGAARRQSAA